MLTLYLSFCIKIKSQNFSAITSGDPVTLNIYSQLPVYNLFRSGGIISVVHNPSIFGNGLFPWVADMSISMRQQWQHTEHTNVQNIQYWICYKLILHT